MSGRAVKRAFAGAPFLAAAVALGMLLAGCGGGSSQTIETQSFKTVSARPDIRVHKITGGRHSPPAEAALAEERTRNPGPPSDLERLHPAVFEKPIAKYRSYSEGQAKQVQAEVAKLQAALAAGDVPAAKADELAAWDHYLLLGAAYGVLGKLDEE